MKRVPHHPVKRLEDLPYIGTHIAADLRKAGIGMPDELRDQRPFDVYTQLQAVMGRRHDPCVLYTLLSVEHFFINGEVVPWWDFTESGKKIIRSHRAAIQSPNQKNQH